MAFMESDGKCRPVQGMPCTNDTGERFVGEQIMPVAGSFASRAMSRGEPGLPRCFVWRNTPYEVAEVLQTWKESGPCKSGGPEIYLRKHWWRVRTAGGLDMTIYFERQQRSRRQEKSRWWLYTVAGKEE
jgi:phosphoribosylglycinamide formyltransferase-1